MGFSPQKNLHVGVIYATLTISPAQRAWGYSYGIRKCTHVEIEIYRKIISNKDQTNLENSNCEVELIQHIIIPLGGFNSPCRISKIAGHF